MRTAASSAHDNVVNFPVPQKEQVAAEDGISLRPETSNGSINILIVDDEPKNLTVLETVLNNPEYRLVKAQSADQALLALLVDQFALLILDIRMPGVTGIELARMIKDRKKTALIPIIFLTAYYNEDQHVLEGYGAGAVDYLHKPVNPDILRSKVAVFADLYRMQREINGANQALLAEIAERRQAQQQLRDLTDTLEQQVLERTRAWRSNAAMLQAATDNASVGLATLDEKLRYTYANPAFSKLFEVTGEVVGKQPGEVLTRDHAEGLTPLLEKGLAGERNSIELDAYGKEPGTRHYSVVCEPERDGDTNVTGVVMVVFDVTERKRSEEHIGLLLREVNHRSKNMLTVVSAIARQTKAHTQEEFVKRFSDRVQALAACHDLLAKREWRSISLPELVRAQLAHFGDLLDYRIKLQGPSLEISAAGAQCVGMAIHELATNAVKHGALSNPEGTVHLDWQVQPDGSGNTFYIGWIERGGPPVVLPAHSGYGSVVIKNVVELNLEGVAQLDFAPPGLCWRLTCPAPNILDGGDVKAAEKPALF